MLDPFLLKLAELRIKTAAGGALPALPALAGAGKPSPLGGVPGIGKAAPPLAPVVPGRGRGDANGDYTGANRDPMFTGGRHFGLGYQTNKSTSPTVQPGQARPQPNEATVPGYAVGNPATPPRQVPGYAVGGPTQPPAEAPDTNDTSSGGNGGPAPGAIAGAGKAAPGAAGGTGRGDTFGVGGNSRDAFYRSGRHPALGNRDGSTGNDYVPTNPPGEAKPSSATPPSAPPAASPPRIEVAGAGDERGDADLKPPFNGPPYPPRGGKTPPADAADLKPPFNGPPYPPRDDKLLEPPGPPSIPAPPPPKMPTVPPPTGTGPLPPPPPLGASVPDSSDGSDAARPGGRGMEEEDLVPPTRAPVEADMGEHRLDLPGRTPSSPGRGGSRGGGERGAATPPTLPPSMPPRQDLNWERLLQRIEQSRNDARAGSPTAGRDLAAANIGQQWYDNRNVPAYSAMQGRPGVAPPRTPIDMSQHQWNPATGQGFIPNSYGQSNVAGRGLRR